MSTRPQDFVNDLVELIIDRIRGYAYQRSVVLKLKADNATDPAAREMLLTRSADFERMSQMFGSLIAPDSVKDPTP